jgi:hypothetical protein
MRLARASSARRSAKGTHCRFSPNSAAIFSGAKLPEQNLERGGKAAAHLRACHGLILLKNPSEIAVNV